MISYQGFLWLHFWLHFLEMSRKTPFYKYLKMRQFVQVPSSALMKSLEFQGFFLLFFFIRDNQFRAPGQLVQRHSKIIGDLDK